MRSGIAEFERVYAGRKPVVITAEPTVAAWPAFAAWSSKHKLLASLGGQNAVSIGKQASTRHLHETRPPARPPALGSGWLPLC